MGYVVRPLRAGLLALAFGAIVAIASMTPTAAGGAGWTTHRDPRGFIVDVPPGGRCATTMPVTRSPFRTQPLRPASSCNSSPRSRWTAMRRFRGFSATSSTNLMIVFRAGHHREFPTTFGKAKRFHRGAALKRISPGTPQDRYQWDISTAAGIQAPRHPLAST